MSKRESVARYNLIINKLRKHPASFVEIADYLAFESEIQGSNFLISKRTFQRDREDIQSLYNIDIAYDFTKKVYYIDFDGQTDANKRILEAFDTFNALSITDRLSDYIHFEKRKSQGTENLYGLLHAIKNHFQIKFTYSKFYSDEKAEREVRPYALKEFKNRWYVLASDLMDSEIKNFALDRITKLAISHRRFEPPADFDVNEYYKYSFGIISPNDRKPTDVVLSFNSFQGKYIKSLPLHESQQILIDNEEELRIRLTLYITHDFFMELLSLGNNVKVLQPASLANELKSTFESALKNYK